MSPSVAIIGGGFSGALLAIRLAAGGGHVRLIERNRRAGVGLAYGACDPHHLLNVPTSRMELGLSPSFADWLPAQGFATPADVALADAFAPRALFGRYVEERLGDTKAVERVRGEAVRIETQPRAVVLADGRRIGADIVVLATGNRAPEPLRHAHDHACAAPDPWAHDAHAALDPQAPVLLVGAGLTMVDIALSLSARGHRGEMIALSRHGLLPARHQAGGAWAPFLQSSEATTARGAFALVRRNLEDAIAQGTPWQRVMDAARPDVARVWGAWPKSERARFLRHARTLWDMRRHRMAPQIADELDILLSSGRLRVIAGRLLGAEPRGDMLDVSVRARGATTPTTLEVSRVINCTGPASDFAAIEDPLFADLRRAGLIRADALRLGLDTRGSALVDTRGEASDWLFALGALTRPAYWEVTAVPEIRAQVDTLTPRLLSGAPARAGSIMQAFSDLGAGI